MKQPHGSERIICEMTRCQNSVYGFILSLLHSPEASRDVLQNTNVVLWQKADQFTENTNFLAWAKEVARYEVLAYRRDQARSRLLFDDSIIEKLAEHRDPALEEPDQRASALEECLLQLTARQHRLIAARYAPGGSVKEIAAERGQSAGAISVTLTRIRKALLDCIESKLTDV